MAYEPDKFPGIDRKEAERFKDVIPKSYIQADRVIGKLLASTDEKTNIIIASDHGFQAISGGMNPYDINIEKFLDILRIREKAIVARFGPGMYLNFQDTELMHQIKDIVSNACLKDTSEKIFNVKMFEKTLIVTKPNWKVDVEKVRKEHTFIDFGEYGIYRIDELYTRQQTKMSGVHKKEGIIIFAGPDIREGVSLDPASIYDVAPTVLHLMGLPVAKDMDGRILTEALDQKFLMERPARYVDTYEDSVRTDQKPDEIDHKKLEERLRSLGYL